MKAALRPASQNCPMDNKILFWRDGKIWHRRAARGKCFSLSSALCVECIRSPFGIVADMASDPAGSTFSQWSASQRKWLDAPESAIARMLFLLLDRQCMWLTNWLLSLVWTHTLLSGQLVPEKRFSLPPFLSANVALSLCPSFLLGQRRLEWLLFVPQLQQ